MAAAANLPSPTKVSGKFNAIYDAYYNQIDPKGLGSIEAMVAAKFLKKSGLSDVVLSRIWDLSDPTGRGFLDREGFFVALKLVALAQAGHDINMRNIFIESQNPPKVGEIPKIVPPKILTIQPHTQDWTVPPADRQKYDTLFESLLPVDGLLPGNKVRSVLMDSKLPLDALSKIWDLADQDKDGSLDKHEFLVAMHLVYTALGRKIIPAGLPYELVRPKEPVAATGFGAFGGDSGSFVANFPTDIAPPPVVPPLPKVTALPPPLIPPMSRIPPSQPSLISTDLLIQTAPIIQPTAAAGAVKWVVSAMDRQRFDAMFKRSDLDNDGLVSGMEIKDVFLQSGIPNLCLAQIWALCDTNQSGKLTSEQFALAMWMVERKRMGYEPPECLAPNMVPPSQRASAAPPSVSMMGDLVGLDDNLMQSTAEPMQPAYSNPELAMISKEIEELSKERRFLENDVNQKEADIRIKTGEVRSLQSELDTLAATLKQLENQKGEAQKRLDDLKTQSTTCYSVRAQLVGQISVAVEKVNKIRDKCQKQEDSIRDMEGELDSKRSELQKLKDEETSLEREYDTNKLELDSMTRNLQDTQLQISQLKGMVVTLQENQRQMNEALVLFKAAISSNDPMQVADYQLNLEPDFYKPKNAIKPKEEQDPEPADKFTTNGFASDAFAGQTKSSGFDTDFSAPSGGFGESFGNTGFQTTDTSKSKNADPFGDKSAEHSITPDPNKDDFGSDPFAILHAPTSASQILSPSAKSAGPPPRPESPSPALPPKKAKQPPPRPAPPRPSMGPTPTRPEPPTAGFGASSGGFADFANFEDTPIQTPSATAESLKKPESLPPAAIEPAVVAKNAMAVPADFADDPFKDYRYEDPFSIKDPFADDAPDDPFASITAVVTTPSPAPPAVPSFIATPNMSPLTIIRSTNNTPVLNNAKQFNGENNNIFASRSPATSAFETTFNNKITDSPSTNSNTTSNHTANSTDFFDAFHDNFNKNTTTSKPIVDPFGVKINNNNSQSILAATFAADFASDNLFEDEFAKLKVTNDFGPTNGNTNTSTSNFAKFDAFNDENAFGSNGTTSDTFADFEDSFASDFSTKSHNKSAAATGALPKDKNASGHKESTKDSRYSADYSKGESFDKDLDEVLKRSLVDQ